MVLKSFGQVPPVADVPAGTAAAVVLTGL